MYKKLMSLKIPPGWAILYNSFGDEDLIVESGTIVNDEFFSEGLLSIYSVKYTKSGWIVDSEGYIIDLEWYPESDPNGVYRLVLLRKNWNNIIMEYQSRNRDDIRKEIERCFDLISQGVDDKKIANLYKLNK